MEGPNGDYGPRKDISETEKGILLLTSLSLSPGISSKFGKTADTIRSQ